MEINKAFAYQFEDVQWPNKLGLGALISLVPILNFAVVGYELEIVRNVAAGAHEPLPQWEDLGKKWREGLILTLAGLIYSLPVLIALALVLAMLAASGDEFWYYFLCIRIITISIHNRILWTRIRYCLYTIT